MIKINRSTLKYIAAGTMLLDHAALVFVDTYSPLWMVMRTLGRLTAPIMCMFLAEGYIHTSSKTKYALRLAAFAGISQIPYTYLVFGRFRLTDFNVIATFLLCFLMLLSIEKIKSTPLKVTAVVLLYIAAGHCDWGLVAPMWVLVFYLFREDSKKKYAAYLMVCLFWVVRCCAVTYSDGGLWYNALWQAGVFAAFPLIYYYDGSKGRTSGFSKWFFYWFYPLHLLVLGIIFRSILPLI